MLTIAIVNEKGGSGKTTTSVNLAAALGAVNQRVLLVDLDGQAAATRWLGVEGDTRFADALWRGEGLEPLKDITPNVDLAPGHAKLDSVAHDLRPTQGGQLRKLLREVEDDYDLCMIDCPPSLGNRLIGNALVAATHAIVPVETSILAMDCMQSLLETIQDVREGLGHEIELMGILACRFDGRTNLSRSVLGELHRALPGKVLNTIIRENVKLRECPASGESILTYDPRSTGAQDYIYLADEVVSIIEGTWEQQEPGEDSKPRKKKSKAKGKSKSKAAKAQPASSQTATAESADDAPADPKEPQADDEPSSSETPAAESADEPDDRSPTPDEPKPVATIEVPDVAEEVDWSTVSFEDSDKPDDAADAPEATPADAPEIKPAQAQWNLDNASASSEQDEESDEESQETDDESADVSAEPDHDDPVVGTPAVEELSWNLDGQTPSIDEQSDTQPETTPEASAEQADESSENLAWDLNAETPASEQPTKQPDPVAETQQDDAATDDTPDESGEDDLPWQLDSGTSQAQQTQTVSALDEAADNAPPADQADESDSSDDELSFDATPANEPDEPTSDFAPAAGDADDILAEASAPTDVPTPAWPTAESEFYRPILEAIASLGGSAKEEHIIERIREIMDGKLNDVDLAPPADGRSSQPVWQQTVQKAKRLLTIDGLMKEQRFRRTWKITGRGKEAVANQQQERIYD
ncbi:MAG: AAA family ATPase [Phycisphaerae bacterium]